MLKTPEHVVGEVLRNGCGFPSAIIRALKDEGWHLVSDIQVEQRDDPPIPDEFIERPEYSLFGEAMPHRIFRQYVRVDDQVMQVERSIGRHHLAQLSHDSQFLAYEERALAIKLMSALSKYLGGPDLVNH